MNTKSELVDVLCNIGFVCCFLFYFIIIIFFSLGGGGGSSVTNYYLDVITLQCLFFWVIPFYT